MRVNRKTQLLQDSGSKSQKVKTVGGQFESLKDSINSSKAK